MASGLVCLLVFHFLLSVAFFPLRFPAGFFPVFRFFCYSGCMHSMRFGCNGVSFPGASGLLWALICIPVAFFCRPVCLALAGLVLSHFAGCVLLFWVVQQSAAPCLLV